MHFFSEICPDFQFKFVGCCWKCYVSGNTCFGLVWGLISVAYKSPCSPWVPSSQACCRMDEACCKYSVEQFCIWAEPLWFPNFDEAEKYTEGRERHIIKGPSCGKCISCSFGFFQAVIFSQWLSCKTEISRKVESNIKRCFVGFLLFVLVFKNTVL